MVVPIGKHNETKKNEDRNEPQKNIFSLSNHKLELINTNQSYPFGSKKLLNDLYNKTMKKFNSTVLVDFDLERIIQTLVNDTEGIKNNNQNHTERMQSLNSETLIKDFSITKSKDVQNQSSPKKKIIQSSFKTTKANVDNGSQKDEINTQSSKSNSIQQKIKRSPLDTVGIIEYILFAVFIVFDVTLLACCINDKCRGEIVRKFTLCPFNGKINICDKFRSCVGSWRNSAQPYQVISVQEMGSMERTTNTARNDFVFDDQYLELNDNPVTDASLNVPIQPSSVGASKMENLKDRSDNVETNMYQQFSNSIKRMTKPKYVRLDEVSQDDKEHDDKLDEDITHHGYWNPTYFSLIDETDV